MIVTVDELRALQRIAVLGLPAFVTSEDTGEMAVDTAALRGLAARSLVSVSGDGIHIGDALRHALNGCAAPVLLAEVEREQAGRVERFAVAAGPEPPASLLTELEAGLVSVEALDASPLSLVERLVRLDEPVETEAGRPFGVDARAHADADAHVLQGDPDEAVRRLVRSGVAAADARAWVAAVAGRRMSVALSTARRLDGRFAGGELRWLVAGDGTAWRIDAAADDAADTRALIVPGAAASLRRDVRDLMDQKVEAGR